MAFKWAQGLRRDGLWVEIDYGSTGLKSQMKKADRLRADHVLIVGDNELEAGKVVLRNMLTKKQLEVDVKDVIQALGGILRDE